MARGFLDGESLKATRLLSLNPSTRTICAALFLLSSLPTLGGEPGRTAVIALTTSSAALTAEQEDEGRELAKQNCLMCHSQDMLDQQRLTAKQWNATIKKMHDWGAPVDDESTPALVNYLAAHSSPSARKFELRKVSAKEAAAKLSPLPDGKFANGNVTKGAEIYVASCGRCHGADARGAELGTNLTDRPLLWRAPEFAQIVRSGRNRMPAYPDLTDEQIAAVLKHLRGSQK